MSCKVNGKFLVETTLLEEPEGHAIWEGKGLVQIFYAAWGAIAIVSLLLNYWILYLRTQQPCLGHPCDRCNGVLIITFGGGPVMGFAGL